MAKQQTIKFLRSSTTYASYSAAITALNGVTMAAGQPVVAFYTKTLSEEPLTTETRAILALGKDAGTGADKYQILANDVDLQDLSSALGTHEAVLAGTTAGHALSGTEITFTEGVATINANQVTLSKLAKQAKGTVIGVAADNANATDTPTALDGAAVRKIAGLENQYKAAKVDSTTLNALSYDDTLEFVGGTNISLSATAGTAGTSNNTITVDFDGANAALTGTPTAPTAAKNTNTTQIATTAFVVSEIADALVVAQAMVFKGVANSTSDLAADAQPGWTYRAGTAFTLGSEVVEIGDMIVCTAAATTDPVAAATWAVIQNNIDGAVTGPASSTSGNLATFNGTTGKVIQDSGIAAADLVLNTVTVTGTNGLTGGGALSQNQTISHATASPTIGSDSIVTGVTVDSYGHVATVTTGDLSVDITGAGEGKYISSAEIDTTDPLKINYTFADLPAETCKVKVSSTDTEDYLENKIVSGTSDAANNVYGVTVTKSTTSNVDTLVLTCTIADIDGGTF